MTTTGIDEAKTRRMRLGGGTVAFAWQGSSESPLRFGLWLGERVGRAPAVSAVRWEE